MRLDVNEGQGYGPFGTRWRRGNLALPSAAATAAITGTITSSATETNIRSGGKTILITLTNDTWDADAVSNSTKANAIIAGIDSAQAEGTGWDAVVKAGLTNSDMTRNSTTLITVLLPAFASYNITAQETITVTVPANVTAGAGSIGASPVFTVAVDSALAAGTVSFASKTASAITMTATDATGGAGGYTYQWTRNVNGGAFSDLTGKTTLSPMTDSTVTDGNVYEYKVRYTDAVSATVTSSASADVRPWVSVNNQGLIFSPYNTFSDGSGTLAGNNVLPSSTFAQWDSVGAYLKFKVQVIAGAGTVKLELDNSTYGFSGATASKMPTLFTAKDQDSYTTTLLALNTDEITLATGLAAGTYTFYVDLKSNDATDGNAAVWSSSNMRVKILGIDVDTDAVVTAASTFSRKALIYTDSVGIGIAEVSAGQANANCDATMGFGRLLGSHLQAEVGVVGYGGQGFTKGIGNVTASSSAPSLKNGTGANESWDKYHASASRLVGGLLVPTPDVVGVVQAANDGATDITTTVTAWVDALRTAAGSSAWIFVVNEVTLSTATSGYLSAGVAAASSTTKSKYIAATKLFTPASAFTSRWSGETNSHHLNARGQAQWSGEAAFLMEAQMAATGGSGGGSPVNGPL